MRPEQLRRESVLGRNRTSRSPTLRLGQQLTRNLRTPADEENAGAGSEKESDATSTRVGCGDKEKAKTFEKHQPEGESGQLQSLAEIRPSRICPSSEGVSEPWDRGKAQNPLEQFLSSANEEKLALVADDEVDEAIVLYLNKNNSQERLVTDGEVLLVELQLSQPQYGKLGHKLAQAQRALRSWRKRAPTRSRRPSPTMTWYGVQGVANDGSLLSYPVQQSKPRWVLRLKDFEATDSALEELTFGRH